MTVYDDAGYFGSRLREMRHNPCMMTPMSLGMFVIFGLFMLGTLLLQVPALLLGLLLAPILQRSSWYVEFLYPWGIARWAHFLLISQNAKTNRADDKNRGFHSRTIEQKTEVVPGRVYIHPIPQWLDNVGYLVVCLPRPKSERNQNVTITIEDQTDPIVALMIDCGEADATIRAVELIQEYHYGTTNIQIQSILSTHKHHDHTGGNKNLMEHEMGSKITRVYAGAVEKVPQCTHLLANGDTLELPRFQGNDMSELVEIEAVAVPAHTRGSLVYRLRSKASDQSEFMFTGDTMFSAGGGVPFEADIGNDTDLQVNRSTGNTFFRAGSGNAAMERCFSEVLARAMPNDNDKDVGDRILVFPGHEYTSELLNRQFQGNVSDSCRWRNFAPRDFFETVSQMYVALHRRSLPHNSGKLLMIPSTLRREIHISPHFRSLKRTGELVVRAIVFWHDNFCITKVGGVPKQQEKKQKKQQDYVPPKTASTPKKWIVDAKGMNRDVFTTVYTADLESVIDELTSGNMSKEEAARQLGEMTSKLNEPVVNKRAIPGYLPSDRNIYKGLSGLVLLGSQPSAMTLSDSRRMNLPPPIDSNSDRISVNMKRIILVLSRLGLLENNEAGDIGAMVRQLWKEAREYESGADANGSGNHYNGDVEVESSSDGIELGILKWVLYGVPSNQPTWFSKMFCMPCSKLPSPRTFPDHPAAKRNQKSGDLVAHDVLTCLLCRNATGCVEITGSQQDSKNRPLALQTRETESDDEAGLEMEEYASSPRSILTEHE
jgi:glyoxylase-like metal-dependent hydrolase (beta-lactamase superfamily II)